MNDCGNELGPCNGLDPGSKIITTSTCQTCSGGALRLMQHWYDSQMGLLETEQSALKILAEIGSANSSRNNLVSLRPIGGTTPSWVFS